MIFTYFQKICKLDSQICVLECTDSAAITKEQHPPKFMELFYLKEKWLNSSCLCEQTDKRYDFFPQSKHFW